MQASLIKSELILTPGLFCYNYKLNTLVKNKPSEVNTEVDFMAGLTLTSCQRPARASYKLHPFTPM